MKYSIESEKDKVKKLADEYKLLIEDDISELKENSKKLKNNLLLGGGIFLTGYLISRLFISKPEKQKKKDKKIKVIPSERSEETVVSKSKKENSFLTNTVTQSILSQVSFMLLNVAREKLEEYIKKQQEAETNEELQVNIKKGN